MVSPREPTPRPTGLSRRRASRACRSCHKRKVRCDVTRKEGACTNCLFDNIPCEPVARKHRRQRLSFGIRFEPSDDSSFRPPYGDQILGSSTDLIQPSPTLSPGLSSPLICEEEAPAHTIRNITDLGELFFNHEDPRHGERQPSLQAAATREPIAKANQGFPFRYILPKASNECPFRSLRGADGENTTLGTDILAFQSQLYLQLIAGLGLCMSNEMFPAASESPLGPGPPSPVGNVYSSSAYMEFGEWTSQDPETGCQGSDADTLSSSRSPISATEGDSQDGLPTLEDHARQDCLGLFGSLISTS